MIRGGGAVPAKWREREVYGMRTIRTVWIAHHRGIPVLLILLNMADATPAPNIIINSAHALHRQVRNPLIWRTKKNDIFRKYLHFDSSQNLEIH